MIEESKKVLARGRGNGREDNIFLLCMIFTEFLNILVRYQITHDHPLVRAAMQDIMEFVEEGLNISTRNFARINLICVLKLTNKVIEFEDGCMVV